MTKNRIIKSNRRVKHDGEVFTPTKIVERMINSPGMKENIHNIRTTILEPSAGEGAFLLPILRIKLLRALKLSKDSFHYNRYALIALSSLYGVELLEDNVSMLILNMYATFETMYKTGLKHLHGHVNPKVLESARIIIHANIIQGDTIKGVNGNGSPLIMSEWKPVSKFKVKRTNFQLHGEKYYVKKAYHKRDKQLSLNLGDTKKTRANKLQKAVFHDYLPVDIVDVCQELFDESK